MRWIVLLCEVAAIALAIQWGFGAWEETDFYRLHDWAGLWLTLGCVCLIGGALWSFYTLFPSVLLAFDLVSHILAATLFLAAFTAVVALAVGINKIGDRTRPEEVTATFIDYKTHRRASNASTSGHFGVFEVKNGPTFDVPLSVVNKLKLRIGDELPVVIRRGNLYDWGWLKPLDHGNQPRPR